MVRCHLQKWYSINTLCNHIGVISEVPIPLLHFLAVVYKYTQIIPGLIREFNVHVVIVM